MEGQDYYSTLSYETHEELGDFDGYLDDSVPNILVKSAPVLTASTPTELFAAMTAGRISPEALAVYTYLYNYWDKGSRITSEKIASLVPGKGRKWGQRVMRELREAGFLVRVRVSLNGKIVNWVTHLTMPGHVPPELQSPRLEIECPQGTITYSVIGGADPDPHSLDERVEELKWSRNGSVEGVLPYLGGFQNPRSAPQVPQGTMEAPISRNPRSEPQSPQGPMESGDLQNPRSAPQSPEGPVAATKLKLNYPPSIPESSIPKDSPSVLGGKVNQGESSVSVSVSGPSGRERLSRAKQAAARGASYRLVNATDEEVERAVSIVGAGCRDDKWVPYMADQVNASRMLVDELFEPPAFMGADLVPWWHEKVMSGLELYVATHRSSSKNPSYYLKDNMGALRTVIEQDAAMDLQGVRMHRL